MSFFGLFAKKKVENAVESFADLLVRFDPQTATEAQIEQLNQHLVKVSQETAQARTDYQREQKEADDILKLYNQRLAAAEILQKQSLEANEAQKASFEQSLTKLVQTLEGMRPDVEREKREADDAKTILSELEAMTNEAAEQLRNAKQVLSQARREMEKAKVQEQRALRQEERVKALAGLKQRGDGFNTALDAMKKAAEKSKTNADAAQMRAKLLEPKKAEQADVHIVAAMDQAAGQLPASSSVSERLAALKPAT